MISAIRCCKASRNQWPTRVDGRPFARAPQHAPKPQQDVPVAALCALPVTLTGTG